MEHTYLLDPPRFRSMHTMLQEECNSGMHAPGGMIADPSAAIGLLWARRGLLFWVSFFRPHAEAYAARRRRESKERGNSTASGTCPTVAAPAPAGGAGKNRNFSAPTGKNPPKSEKMGASRLRSL